MRKIPPTHEHAHGLAHDLPHLLAQTSDRRRALQILASGGAATFLAGCSSGGSEIILTDDTDTSGGSSGGGGSSGDDTDNGECTAYARETAGPYPADGSNGSGGTILNALAASGIVRSDIRPSLSSSGVADGVAMTLTMEVVNTNNNCERLTDHAIYLWHCDALGRYSLYDVPGESWLRGVAVTDSSGMATMTTIFPGCYAGRWPHMHFEVFSSAAAATSYQNAQLISQLAMPADVCNAVYANSAYTNSASNFSRVSLAGDNVFGDNSSAQMTAMTPDFMTAGSYSASVTIGVAL